MSWIAVKSSDPASVARFLGLEGTFQESCWHGIEATYDTKKSDHSIFITPAYKGWVLIVGDALPLPLGPAFSDKCTPLLASLSKEFSEAQYFACHPELDFFCWAKAVDSQLIRAFASSDEGSILNYGRLSSAEITLGLKHFEFRGLSCENGDVGEAINLVPTVAYVLALASHWSVDPVSLSEFSNCSTSEGVIGSAPTVWRSTTRIRENA